MDDIFITPELIDSARDAARRRSDKQIAAYSNQLYGMICAGVSMALNHKQDYIIRVIDRKVGKTHCLAHAAAVYSLPVIVPNRNIGEIMRREAEECFGAQIDVVSIKGHCDGVRRAVFLKEEGVSVSAIRNKIKGEYAIIGFDGIYD